MKTVIQSANAPAAIGPYSQAIRSGNLLFLSGQIPVNPATGEVVEGGVEAQARQVFANIAAVLAEAGTDMSAVLKTTVFLQSLGDFAAVNALYAEAFPAPYPARSCVEVSKLPKGVLIEVECIAAL